MIPRLEAIDDRQIAATRARLPRVFTLTAREQALRLAIWGGFGALTLPVNVVSPLFAMTTLPAPKLAWLPKRESPLTPVPE